MEAGDDPRGELVHDWLTGMPGGGAGLEVACRRWPAARLFTLRHRPGSVSPAIEALRRRTSFLQHVPGVHRHYRYLLPLMPLAVGTWRLPACDLVISFSHCVAKAVRPPRDVPHVCYCFTPMRYAWHIRNAYFGGDGRSFKARLRARLLQGLRDWGRRAAERVPHFVAVSQTAR